MHLLTLRFIGHVPVKKNNLRRGARGGVFIQSAVSGDINSLLFQAREQWNVRQPIETVADIDATFEVLDGRSDLDGKYTTIQDVLVKARVLRNDSIARIRKFRAVAVISDTEETTVKITYG